MNKVAVVILNWNGEKFLKEFLPALVANTPTNSACPTEIAVADNASTDNSLKFLHENYPEVRTVPLDMNYGFTGGYNRALAQIEARYFVLLNSDILVPQGWLEPLVSFMDTHPHVGICQPKMLSYARHQEILKGAAGNEVFEYAGACGGFIDVLGFPFCRGRVLGKVEEDYAQYNTPQQIFWASGACMVVRSTIWRELGGLDESFFAHMEEIDFCWRAQLLGHQVWVVPQSHVYHVGGGTLPNNSPSKLFFNYRNNLLMLYKNLPVNEGWEAFGMKRGNRNLYIFCRMCTDMLTATIYLLQFKWSFFKAVLKAHKAFLRMKKDTAVTLKDNRRCTPYGIWPKSILVYKLFGKPVKF